MEIRKILPVLILCSLAASCGGKKNGTDRGFSDQTLRKELTERQRNEKWAAELEGGLLSEKRDRISGISDKQRLSPEVMDTISGNPGSGIYPLLDGFGSLDIRGIEAPQRTVLDAFCSAVTAGTAADSCMADGSGYSLALFLADIGGQKPFLSWVYGKPFINEQVFQVPVRFFQKNGTLDIAVYLDSASSWKIDQIQIRNMQAEENGKK